MEMGTDFSLLAAWCDARASFVPTPCQPAALPAREYKLLVVNLDNTLLRSNKTLSPAAVRLIAAASAKGKQVVVCSGRAASEALPYWGTQPDGSPGLAAAGVRHAILSFGCETWAMGATPEQSRATCRTLLAPRMVRCVMDVLRNRDLLVQAVMDDGYFHASERMDTMVRLRDQPVSRAARSTRSLAFRRIRRGHEKLRISEAPRLQNRRYLELWWPGYPEFSEGPEYRSGSGEALDEVWSAVLGESCARKKISRSTKHLG